MIVTSISALVRYSRDTGRGAWKVVELGAEASIWPDDYWMDAQAELRRQLDYQMKKLRSVKEPLEEADDGGY